MGNCASVAPEPCGSCGAVGCAGSTVYCKRCASTEHVHSSRYLQERSYYSQVKAVLYPRASGVVTLKEIPDDRSLEGGGAYFDAMRPSFNLTAVPDNEAPSQSASAAPARRSTLRGAGSVAHLATARHEASLQSLEGWSGGAAQGPGDGGSHLRGAAPPPQQPQPQQPQPQQRELLRDSAWDRQQPARQPKAGGLRKGQLQKSASACQPGASRAQGHTSLHRSSSGGSSSSGGGGGGGSKPAKRQELGGYLNAAAVLAGKRGRRWGESDPAAWAASSQL